MDYLIRFIQMHETFRKPETETLAELAGLRLEWVSYSEDSPFAIVRFPDVEDTLSAATTLISRSISSSAIYELWGSGTSYPGLHKDVHLRTSSIWKHYSQSSFRFELDSFQGSRPKSQQHSIIESFSYTDFQGPIVMQNPDNQFVIFEEYYLNAPTPHKLHLGRLIAESNRRKAIAKYTLKQRNYIATTSMDAELSLVTANLALAAPGKLAYDPFIGTGSFPLACAHFGACVFGSDLDGRSIRGKSGRNVRSNFAQYGTEALYLDGFVADLTHSPLRGDGRWLDAIICDPPYGVREGLKVLGSTRAALREVVLLEDGMPAHLSETYVPPKKPYSFSRMLDDILDFATRMLVDDGRLCMWMPVADAANVSDATVESQEVKVYNVPQHPELEVVSECVQRFNKWSRRLLTYRRKHDREVDSEALLAHKASRVDLANGSEAALKGTADDLNDFRRRYFQGFKDSITPR